MATTERPVTLADHAATVAMAFGALVSLVSVLRWVYAIVAHRAQGLDPSDEAYYLISAITPDATVARLSNFGYYLHVMRNVTGGTLGGLRIGGLGLLLMSAAVAAWGLTRWLPMVTAKLTRRLHFLGAWACISSVTLTYYALWIVTPSYNLLVLAFALLVFGGLLSALPVAMLHNAPVPWWRPIGGFVLVGCALVGLADVKVTAGAGVATLCAVILVCVLGFRDALGATWSIAVGLLAGITIDLVVVGSPTTTAVELARYARMTSISKAYSASKVWETTFLVETALGWLVWFSAATVVIAVAWRWLGSPRVRSVIMAMSACAVGFMLWSERVRGGTAAVASNGWWWVRMTAWTLLFITALAPRPSRALAIGPIIAVGGIASALGSNNGFIRQTVFTSGLFALAVVTQAMIVVYSADTAQLRALPALVFVVVAAWASFGEVSAALHAPYRLAAPIGANTEPISITHLGSVRVTPPMAAYIADLQALGSLVPLDARNCLVDLSGGTPVSAMALGARSAAVPWPFGGIATSTATLSYLLSFSTCIEGRVLLIESPDGGNRIDLPAVLRGRKSRVVGEVHFHGYVDELQIVSILEPPAPQD